MNDIEIIEGILGITPKKETTKERTIVCRICEKDYTDTVKKGRQPTVCKEEACDEARKKGYQSPKPKVVRTHTDLKCDVEIEQQKENFGLEKNHHKAKSRSKSFREIPGKMTAKLTGKVKNKKNAIFLTIKKYYKCIFLTIQKLLENVKIWYN